MRLVVADTGPLNYLVLIGDIELLPKLFEKIFVPATVRDELALAGDAAALRLCLDRVLGPRRGRPVELALPPIDSAADLVRAMAAVAAAAAGGAITPDEALTLSQMADAFARSLAAREEERRRDRLAAFYAKSAKPPPA
jgi:hypothetical protein